MWREEKFCLTKISRFNLFPTVTWKQVPFSPSSSLSLSSSNISHSPHRFPPPPLLCPWITIEYTTYSFPESNTESTSPITMRSPKNCHSFFSFSSKTFPPFIFTRTHSVHLLIDSFYTERDHFICDSFSVWITFTSVPTFSPSIQSSVWFPFSLCLSLLSLSLTERYCKQERP